MSDDQNQSRILITPDGPYLVSGDIPLIQRYPAFSEYGEPLAWDPVGAEENEQNMNEEYALCRCGHSCNKPFCDGSHHKVEFNNELEITPKSTDFQQLTYEGENLVMIDKPHLCMEAGFCGTRFTDVWDMIERSQDPEIRTRLREMVAKCPSGRLQILLGEVKQADEPEYKPSIALIPDGPLWVRGGIAIQTAEGGTYPTQNRVTLCRCGQSHNMPFCDGTHGVVNFSAPLLSEDEGE